MKQLILSIVFVLTACSFAIAKLENNNSRLHERNTSLRAASKAYSEPRPADRPSTSPFVVVCLPQIYVLLK
jgi:hypothetical protein